MNKYVRMLIEIPTGIIKVTVARLGRFNSVKLSVRCAISPSAEFTLDRGAQVSIGRDYRQRSGSHLRVRRSGTLSIGKNVSINHGCMLVCHEKIVIGDNVQFAPNVMVYDHDHDFKTAGGIKTMKFKSTPIIIGNDVWIGANSVILRGSKIGDGAVIGAGSIVKGEVQAGTVFVQKRECNKIIGSGE